jgi:TPR repeat protein
MTFVDRVIGLISPTAALRRAVGLSEQQKFTEAFPLFATAARAGIPDAEYRIAQCYLQGTGVPLSQAEGARWLQRAAAHGSVEAQCLLGALYVHGLRRVPPEAGLGQSWSDRLFTIDTLGEPDYEAALHWSRKAAEAGSPKGEALLAYILSYGPQSVRDLEQAHGLYAHSAAAGCPEGSLGYALSLARHATDDAGRREVVEYLRHAADAGLPTAIYLLATLVENGIGTASDPRAAAQLYCEAAEKGNRAAQIRWGLELLEGRDVDQDRVAGESWLRRAALAGDPEAAVLVGNLYTQSGPLPPNYSEAANWYRRAAEAGHKGAARALGSLYLTGAGVPRDSDEAARWLGIAANAGDPAAQVDLANLVLEGGGDAQDPARIAGWFQQAALLGDLTAAFNLGVCFVKGVGVERNDEQAATWLRRAAEGVPEAQFMYGRLLAEGRGVSPDLRAARQWFAKAADAGVLDAQVALAEMMVNGRGGPLAPAGALELFKEAADKRHSGAMFALGALYSGGHNLPIDRTAAQRWFRAAAELGHGQAQLMLGRYLIEGAAGELNLTEGQIWLQRAAAQGISEAEGDLAHVGTLTSAEVA